MTMIAILLAVLTGVMIPLVQADAAEKTAEIFKVSESAVFEAHYWGGWFHDWTPLWLLGFLVSLVAFAMKPAAFKWVMFTLLGAVIHLVTAYSMSWVVWGAGALVAALPFLGAAGKK